MLITRMEGASSQDKKKVSIVQNAGIIVKSITHAVLKITCELNGQQIRAGRQAICL